MLFTFTAHHGVDESEREHARDEEEHRHVTLGSLGRRTRRVASGGGRDFSRGRAGRGSLSKGAYERAPISHINLQINFDRLFLLASSGLLGGFATHIDLLDSVVILCGGIVGDLLDDIRDIIGDVLGRWARTRRRTHGLGRHRDVTHERTQIQTGPFISYEPSDDGAPSTAAG